MNKPRRSRWFSDLADSEIDALHRHVRLVYPFASTENTVVEAFGRASRGAPPTTAPTARAWLRQLARAIVLDGISDDLDWRRRNAEMIRLDFVDSAASLVEPLARVVALDLASRFDRLEPEMLEALRMMAVESLDVDEIAYVLGMPTEAVEGLFDAARTRLSANEGPMASDQTKEGP